VRLAPDSSRFLLIGLQRLDLQRCCSCMLAQTRSSTICLAVLIAAGVAFVATSPGRGEESPAYAIEVSDVTAKVGEPR
jgi:hypothetical protein